MRMQKFSIFWIQGGLGKHIAATAVCKAIKSSDQERKLIVVCAYPDIFINLSYVDRVYAIGSTQYFYQTYIEGCDSLIFHNEPYFTTDHIYKRKPLAETWCHMYGIEYNGETPELVFNPLQIEAARNYWLEDDSRPLMLLHTNGGLIHPDAKPYLWARDMPCSVAEAIVDRYKDQYRIIQSTKNKSPKLPGCEHVFFGPETQYSVMEYLSVLLHTSKRVLIDSSLQHAAAALGMPSVVLWNGTSPSVFGHAIHTNIETTKPANFKLPNSVFFDFDFMGVEEEYPFNTSDTLFDLDEVFAAIEDGD